jgi:Leucine-rich repeat (LRR) protein
VKKKKKKKIEIRMEILFAIAGKVVDYTVRPVGRWLCYSFHYNNNIVSMNKQVANLRNARDRVLRSIDAIPYGDEIHDDVKNWLKEADEIIELFNKDFEGEEAGTKSCSSEACLNLKVRHQLSHKAAKIVTDTGEVLKNKSFDTVSYRPARQPQGIETLSRTEYMPSESRMSTVERLMEALRDDNIHVIGVWGMPGVGKSTLVREVAKQAKEEKLFDEVVIANVTQSPDLRRIQGEVADMLDLKLDKETEPGRAIYLKERLRKKEDKKMVLVILDDIWEKLVLEDLGIPSEGCKVLLTSRNRDVFVSGMNTQKDFKLEVLSEEEAWSLFEKMAGDCVNKDSDMRSAATEVAKACGGLPLALVTVSKALKNKELFEWNNALLLLKRPAPEHLNKMQSTIYSSIELSYKHLKETNKEALDVFLHCAQMGYYIFKMDLLKYCCGLGLFHGINTMEDARNRLYTILRILEDCCLLLPYSFESLRMHDVVRDAATLIASRDYNMFVVRVDGGLREWPNADALKRCRAFYLRGGDVLELPDEMECPELSLLYLWGGGHQFQISDTLFEGTGKLKVLDLTKMQLSSLPSALGLLRNLQTLCLDQCVLGDIAVIGELKNLAILSLLHSRISQLPREIGLLTRLRLLDLSHCSELKVIPPNVLSSLVALEELYMGNSFVQWSAEGLNNASIAELKNLSHLITLEIHIPDANNLPKDLLFEKLERYVILVGDVWDWPKNRGEASRKLKLKLDTSFQFEVGIQLMLLMKRTENLYLNELKGVESVLNKFNREGFQQLKHLHIQNNTKIKYIINLSTLVDIAFPALKTIILKNLTGLEEICHAELSSLKSFGNLRVVKVKHCDKLKFVFSPSVARGLSQLEKLEIRECRIMGAIVMKEEGEIEDTDLILFPKLRFLALRHLPKLINFLSTQNLFITDAGENISKGKLDFYTSILHGQVHKIFIPQIIITLHAQHTPIYIYIYIYTYIDASRTLFE